MLNEKDYEMPGKKIMRLMKKDINKKKINKDVM